MFADERIRELQTPLTPDQLRPLASTVDSVQFCGRLTPPELRRAGAFLSEYPSVRLRVYGMFGDETYTDLEFLEWFQTQRRVYIDLWGLTDIGGLRFLRPDLRELILGRTKKTFSMSALGRFSELEVLWLDGHRRNVEIIASMPTLRTLSLRSITLPDLRLLAPLKGLERFWLGLGGTTRLIGLDLLERLKHLEIWLVRRLSDLRVVGSIRSLESLHLQALGRVTSLPSFAALATLRTVHLETMRGLKDLSPIAAAPALTELRLVDMRQLTADSMRPFLGHPTLRAARVGTGSARRNAEISKLLGLPDVT